MAKKLSGDEPGLLVLLFVYVVPAVLAILYASAIIYVFFLFIPLAYYSTWARFN